MEEEKKSTLIIIGGGEDKRADKKILKEIVKLSGDDKAKIGIVTTATKYPMEVGTEYENIFYDLGAREVNTINIDSRDKAKLRGKIKEFLTYDCLFFAGGDQVRISSILGGTDFHKALNEFYLRGRVIAGTSAGASMMSEVMIVDGSDEEAPRKCTLKMAPGMGLINNVIIDQHFNQRGRIGRLLAGVAQNPEVIGIGIDEDTALIVDENLVFKVIGKGVVTVVDGTEIEYTNTSEQYPNDPLALTSVKLHILPQDYGFDLKRRKTIIKDDNKQSGGDSN